MARSIPLLLLMMTMVATAASGQVETTIPDWFLEHLSHKTAEGGVWIADNSEYADEDGGIEQYAIEWRLGLGGKSMTGRLYGLRDGEEVGTFWDFRLFWHPGLQEARVYQFSGSGGVGVGSLEPPGEDGVGILVQDFYAPDGSVTRGRHVTRVEAHLEDGRSETWSDGEWRTRRTYVWHRRR